MTVPVQRGGSHDDPTVTNLILSAIDDLKNGFVRLEERISARVEDQAKQFLPRGEYEARHSDVRNQVTKIDARIDAEVARLESRVDAEATERKSLEEKLTSGRRFMYTATATGLMFVLGLLSLVLANLR